MIELVNVTKSYNSITALHPISLKLQKGDKLALLGLNGAGKSTLIKILSGYFFSDAGQYKIFDTEVTPKTIIKLKRYIGYLPEGNPLYNFMIVEEYLRFVGRFYGIKKSRLYDTMEMTDIAEMKNMSIKTLSKGYRQRVGLAAAMLHNPEILILDEPSTGLDINQSYNMRQLLKTIMKDKLVIFSSHTIQEIEEVSDSLLVLQKGTHLIQQKAPYNDIIGFIKGKNQEQS